MSEVQDKKWYVVRAISGQENKIKTFIDNEVNRLNLKSFVEEVIVPTQKVIQIRNGKKVSKEKVYFPGYIMVKANLTGEIPHIIRSFPNILGFLGETKGGDPIPLRPTEVSRMLGKVDELAMEGENIAIPFTVGENIKVIDGPFNDFNGVVEEVNYEKNRLHVAVTIFGRSTPVELDFGQVEKG